MPPRSERPDRCVLDDAPRTRQRTTVEIPARAQEGLTPYQRSLPQYPTCEGPGDRLAITRRAGGRSSAEEGDLAADQASTVPRSARPSGSRPALASR